MAKVEKPLVFWCILFEINLLNPSNSFQYFEHIEEMEWAIEVCKETGLPIAASMCIGPEGDMHGVSSAECAVRMAKAGASVGK